ncbi:hypothetical protein P152DRAFT_454541 [Eremomyces bilateralis CBS 781.70]|uniref:Uncharacterized protein n=1 Tax=Eremomyces bilateralis CBS 781.70 TaxID=1392243 RepID=A0A6G1GDZ8_9PEZI|nr:uncharacterized protein P152DRAFT_454541 [Eremomyces bilateralis CBS 781.70]KAF1816278.1 hypothetical protein P152DRAFT_454541 [Eremomyces bilateralis CBS 781.70]
MVGNTGSIPPKYEQEMVITGRKPESAKKQRYLENLISNKEHLHAGIIRERTD